MSTLAILGAGPGLGLAIAKKFGAQGFKVALLSNATALLEPLVVELGKAGIEAAAFFADVTDRASVTAGLDAVKKRFGQIDVLEISPLNPKLLLVPVLDVTPENVQPLIEFSLYGAIAAVNHVLPEMTARGSGTILFTTGASSIHPEAGAHRFANYAIAAAAIRSYSIALHEVVASKGVQVAQVAIAVFIGQGPGAAADDIAPLFWELHTKRDLKERVFVLESGMQ